MSGPRLLPPRSNKGRYGMVLAVFVVVGSVLQFNWMQEARKNASTDTLPPGFAKKISQWMLQKKGIAVEEAEPGFGEAEKIVCESCQGSGYRSSGGHEKEMCPICQGVGFRMIRRLDASDRKCPACGGMGRVEFYDTGNVGTCPRCDGRGLIRVQVETQVEPSGK